MTQEFKKLTQEQLDLISKPLPREAVTQHPTKSNLSTIKAIYVTERLNQVFGIGSWRIRTNLIDNGITERTRITSSGKERTEYTAIAKTILDVKDYGIYYECIASSVNDDPGDACKGATTDAITKICSYIGIGIDVFKGQHDVALKTFEDNSIQEPISTINGMTSKDDITNYAKSLDDSIKLNPVFRKSVADKLKSL
jgi:hypothetical protein